MKTQAKPLKTHRETKNRNTNKDNTTTETKDLCELKAGLIDKKRNLEQLIDRCAKCRERHQSFFGSEL